MNDRSIVLMLLQVVRDTLICVAIAVWLIQQGVCAA
jgi:hypothetical protein